jgi:hypothetical protein
MIPSLVEFLNKLPWRLFMIFDIEQRATGTPVNIVANFIGQTTGRINAFFCGVSVHVRWTLTIVI